MQILRKIYNPDATIEEEEGNNWTENNPSVRNFIFIENSGMNIDVPDNANPMYFFELLLTEQLIQESVTIKTVNSSCPLRRRSKLETWKDVTH